MQFAALAFPAIDPVMLRIGPLAIHWYGMAYVVGILVGWQYARSLAEYPRLWGASRPIPGATIDDFLVWTVAGIILGGRLGYVLFYDLPAFAADPAQIAKLWTGGMSFHGGLIGMILAMAWFARRRAIPLLSLFDIAAASTAPGLMLGRIANFINQELWGRPTDLPWGVVFPEAGPEPRHPSQLYEAALEGVLMFLLLRLLTHRALKLKQPGFVAGAFLVIYAAARIAVEFVRLPDVQIGYLAGGWLTLGMVLSLPMAALGLFMMARARQA